MALDRRTLLLASLLAGVTVSLVSDIAQACDWQPGIVGTDPHVETTIASGDALVVSVLDADPSQYTWQVRVNDEDVAFEAAALFEEQTVFIDTQFVAITLAEAPRAGSTLDVRASGDSFGGFEGSYSVGASDPSDLLEMTPAVSMSLEFVGADEGDSCGLPDHFQTIATLDSPLPFIEGQRSRFLELVFYPSDGSPADAVGRSIRAADDSQYTDIYGDFAGDVDVSTLCGQVSVMDALGESQVLFEDCDLCDSFPEACGEQNETGETETGGSETDGGESDGGETDGGESDGGSGGAESDTDSAGGAEGSGGGGCSMGGELPLTWSLFMLGIVGANIVRRRR